MKILSSLFFFTSKTIGMTSQAGKIQLGLNKILSLVKHLSNPQIRVPVVHIAGTNGKGSVCAFLDSILSKAGMRVGRFNSPHLIHPSDSIVLAGKTIDPDFYKLIRANVESVDERECLEASPFEKLTAAAIDAFYRVQPPLDICIIEVGMGGAEDATNIFPAPILTVLTSVDLDHQAFLGSTIEEITKVKCGILKPGRPMIVAPQRYPDVVTPIIKAMAEKVGSPLYFVHDPSDPNMKKPTELATLPAQSHLGLEGPHQQENAQAAVHASRLLSQLKLKQEHFEFDGPTTLHPEKFNDQIIREGLEHVEWPGRLEWLDVKSPSGDEKENENVIRVLADGAHNASSASCLRDYVETVMDKNKEIVFIVGVSKPREAYSLIGEFIPTTFLKDSNDGQASSSSSQSGSDKKKVTIIGTEFSTPEEMPWVESWPGSIIEASVKKLKTDLGNHIQVESLTAKDIKQALELAHSRMQSSPQSFNDFAIVCGSLYLISDLAKLGGKHVKRST